MAVSRSGNSGWAVIGRVGVLGALVSIGVAGCSSALTPAPIVDRSTGGGAPPIVLPTTPPGTLSAAGGAAIAPPVQPEAGPGFYRVKPGDTLYGIARAQKQRPSDLIKWNNLPESKQVNIDQLLRVAPPGSTPSGTTTASTDDGSKQASSAAGPKSGPPIIGAPATTANSSTAPDTSTPAINSKGAWLAWPAQGDVITKFGEGGSKGIDIGGKLGEPVKAAAAGRVVYAGSGLRAYGQMIIVKHGSDFLTAYAHNSKLLVKEGDTVRQGAPIAEMGTGPSNKPLLHFELRKSGQAVDPVPSLKKAG
ncbi:peptidoglycan DD-metalloendopeptidase family protein [Caballeronia sp. SEWSISQ10-4 2]|uniref:peptidoglycan DD-metalloendopeptidase family protein n=1 Tax=Caballeronia sp. SEWSISQ10-4 2 TaxID=2937438 RepID=UPI00264B82EE|nr:peptidoglycan DD-metalloendopeptidase family protein [Caballeronia sp. SEWSISQ10-4 2]MDN7179915.1 peptidoglycan DD-metalloendopeptidase family protein [Caballeronia sp. SEWSISQ10-4 2]